MTWWPCRLVFIPGRRRPTTDQLTVLALGALATLAPFFLRPEPALVGTHTQLLLPPCLLYTLTSVPCPTCGMTTSFSLMAHGRLLPALLAHPLGAPFYLYLAGLTLVMLGATLAGRAVAVRVQANLPQMAAASALCWLAKLVVWYLV
ncbi:MAG: DUF2752 domain-containing protein [Patescibacteria group bacterium]